MAERKFKVNVRKGEFVFDPEQPWVYLPDDTVQWVSETGKMTVLIGGHVEYSSPFDDLKDGGNQQQRLEELKGRRFKTIELEQQPERKTRQVTVQSVFPPRQQLLRRLAAAGALTYDFTFEVTTPEGAVYVKTVRGLGSMC